MLRPGSYKPTAFRWWVGDFMYLSGTRFQNAVHFVGVAYLPNKISKTGLKMQAFYTCFVKSCLALNRYHFISFRSYGVLWYT